MGGRGAPRSRADGAIAGERFAAIGSNLAGDPAREFETQG